MKQIILLAFLGATFLAPAVSKAQTIPNSSFEDWQTTTTPKNWAVVSGTMYKLNGISYKKTTNNVTENLFRPAKDGSTCIQISNAVNGSNLARGIIKDSFACTSKPDWFNMNMAYLGSGAETYAIVIVMTKWNSTNGNRDTILKFTATGAVANVEPWSTIGAQLTTFYTGTDNPDTCRIAFINTVATQSTQTTSLYIDDMWFSSTQAAGIVLNSSPVANVSAYPNPFMGQTTIHYNLVDRSNVTLKVYDMSGKEVATLVNNESQVGGSHDVVFNADGLKTGMYIYRLQSGAAVETGKLILNK